MDKPVADTLPTGAALERALGHLAVRVGVNLQPGQELVLTTPSSALPLARAVTEAAYAAGAGLVTPFISDGALARARFAHGHDAAFDSAPGWLYDAMARAFDAGASECAVRPANTVSPGASVKSSPSAPATAASAP